ncbi:ABC transporter ATP-binding protein [Nocardioides daejeonensis]|uniref:ABC transporter ATP-binding protein n=1 Tax=Nocardioides daejeonensis TaxID=1046556 RepID=UPI000D742820|nr:ABC transporter ATP-binding protein [Nocardioides daejeonensis]
MTPLFPTADLRTTTRASLRLVATRRWPLLGAALSFLCVGACALVPPWMLGRIVDIVTEGGSSITRPIVAIVLAAVGSALFTALSVALLARAAEPAVAELREEVLDRALHVEASALEASGTGDLLARVGDDARLVADSVRDFVPSLINSVVLICFTLGGLAALDWRLALAGLLAAPFYARGLWWYLPRSGPRYREERIAQGQRAQAMVGALNGAETVRALGLQEQQLERVDQRSGRARDITLGVFVLLTKFFAAANRAEVVGLCAVLGTGFWLVHEGQVTVGAVTAAALYFHRLFDPVSALLFVFDKLQSAGASLARLVGLAETAPAAPAVPPEQHGALELRGISHAYVAGRPVLQPTDLRVAPGERVAVVGATGAGKSTLGRIAAGLLPPTTGQAFLAGHSYEDLGRRGVRSRVVMVSQEGHVFAGTVLENLTLGRPDASLPEVEAALETVGLKAWLDTLPDRLDTVVGDGGMTLTPARAQQLALARVELLAPWFVVLDEATAEAGSAGARDLDAAATAVTQGRGALVIAHRLSQSAQADRVVVMADGAVVETGTHEELAAAGGRYAEFWAAWTGA